MIENTRRKNITAIKPGDVEVSPDDRIYLVIDIKQTSHASEYLVTVLSQRSEISVSAYWFYESIMVIDHDL